MKLLVAFVAVCVFVVVQGENCRQVSDCNFETCTGDGWKVSCHFGQCTCDHDTHTGGQCTSAASCSGGTRCPGLLKHHCVDGKCRCSF